MPEGRGKINKDKPAGPYKKRGQEVATYRAPVCIPFKPSKSLQGKYYHKIRKPMLREANNGSSKY